MVTSTEGTQETILLAPRTKVMSSLSVVPFPMVFGGPHSSLLTVGYFDLLCPLVRGHGNSHGNRDCLGPRTSQDHKASYLGLLIRLI